HRLHVIDELISITLMAWGPASAYVPSESNVTADRNLLFGLLAPQNEVINQAQLVLGYQARTLDKTRTLADHVEASGDLNAPRRGALEGLVEVRLEAHGGLVEISLAAVSAGRSTRESMADLGDQVVGCCHHVQPSGLGLRWNGLVGSTVRVFRRPGAA